MDSTTGLPLNELTPPTDPEPVFDESAEKSALPPTERGRQDRIRYLTGALAVGLLVMGALWRFIDLAYPPSFSFDEHHFVLNARNYIARQADWNDHPPLGKLLLIPAIRLFGDNGLGWRLSSAGLGLVIVALAGLIAGKVFTSKRVGLLAAAFVAIDGFFISYSRTALLDTPMTAFIYGALALMLWGDSLAWFAAAAVCVGLAVATKWTGVCIILVAPWLLRGRKRSPLHAIWMFGVASLVYMAVLAIALRITRQPISIPGVLASNLSLLKHHAGFVVWDNAASSKWYTWFFLVHPIVMHYAAVGATAVRATTSLGNVLLWYSTTAAILWTLFAGSRALWRRRVRKLADVHGPDRGGVDRRGLFMVATMVALMLPFIVTRRQSYIFHYLGAYGLGLGLLASWVVTVEERFPELILAFVALAGVVSIFYAPVWTNAVVSKTGFLVRLPFPGWR